MKPAGRTTVRKQLAATNRKLLEYKNKSKELDDTVEKLGRDRVCLGLSCVVSWCILILVCVFLFLFLSTDALDSKPTIDKAISAAYSSGLAEGRTKAEQDYASQHSKSENKSSQVEDEEYNRGYQQGLIDGADSLLKEMGLMNPYTHTTIENREDYEEYIEQYNAEYQEWLDEISSQGNPEGELEAEISPSPTPLPHSAANMVWVPTNGGKKYHRTSGCSGMKDPEQVTLEEAENMGFEPCGKCY